MMVTLAWMQEHDILAIHQLTEPHGSGFLVAKSDGNGYFAVYHVPFLARAGYRNLLHADDSFDLGEVIHRVETETGLKFRN